MSILFGSCIIIIMLHTTLINRGQSERVSPIKFVVAYIVVYEIWMFDFVIIK